MDISVSIRNLVDKFERVDFDFRKPAKIYNPIEFFLGKVIQKENSHSLLIADLLAPQGGHGVNTIFLNAFILAIMENRNATGRLRFEPASQLDAAFYNQIDLTKTKVFTECFIKTDLSVLDKEYDVARGRIDIFVKCFSDDGRCILGIIIENKLNGAPFRYLQLEKYKKAIAEGKDAPEKIIVVCFQKSRSIFEKAVDIIFTPDDLADLIEKGCIYSQIKLKELLKCYTTYLRNIGMNTAGSDNARKLLPILTEKDLRYMKMIKEAYDELPNAYAKEFRERCRNYIDGMCCQYSAFVDTFVEIDNSYPHYVDIWRQTDKEGNDISWRWLSVGFYMDSVCFYLVSSQRDENRINNYAKNVGFTYECLANGWRWYTSESLSKTIMFADNQQNRGIPNFDEILILMEEYLKILENDD